MLADSASMDCSTNLVRDIDTFNRIEACERSSFLLCDGGEVFCVPYSIFAINGIKNLRIDFFNFFGLRCGFISEEVVD